MGSCASTEGRRNRDRARQEKKEKKAARKKVKKFCKGHKDQYKLKSKPSTNIGARLQKYWFLLKDLASDQDSALLSISPVSANCSLKLDTTDTTDTGNTGNTETTDTTGTTETNAMTTLKTILAKMKEHPYLQTVHGMWHLPSSPDDDGGGKGQVIVIQDFHENGSLRDFIFNGDSKRSLVVSWSKKYSNEGMPIEVKEIAMFGAQILQAIKFLYKSGFQTLGHVHVGNVFICEDEDGQKMCKLGGYDQTLLGYRPRLYRDILRMNLLEHIDVIMFGHVVFEMGSGGTSLSGVIPTPEEYDKVTDHTVREVLHYIFEHRDFKKIRNHRFFKDEYVSRKVKIPCQLSSEEKTLLTAVHAPYVN